MLYMLRSVMFSAYLCHVFIVFFFNQKTAYDMRISDWSSDVCSSDLPPSASLLRFARRPVFSAAAAKGKPQQAQQKEHQRGHHHRGAGGRVEAERAEEAEADGEGAGGGRQQRNQIGRGAGRERECEYVEM